MRDIPLFLARLKLDTDADPLAIRRAYARELKLVDQQHDAANFQYLREAYEMALRWAGYRAAQPAPAGLGQGGEADDEVQQAPAPRPGYGVPGVAVKLKSEIKREPAAAPVAADGVELTSPYALANAVFAKFQAACVGHAGNHLTHKAAAWEAQLRAHLDDDELLNIEARTIFEELMAQLLAGGWQTGHDTLLAVASAAFNWQQDRRRLNRFGFPGARLSRAIDQRNCMDAHEIDVITRLNTPGMPSGGQLKRDMSLLEPMMARFPDAMALMVDPQTVAKWRELYRNMPGVASAAPFDIDESRMPKSNAKNAPSVSAGWGAGALLLLLAMGSILSNATQRPTSAPAPHAPVPYASAPYASVFETGKPFELPFPPALEVASDAVPASMRTVRQPAQREVQQEAEGEPISQQHIDDINARIRYAPASSAPPGERLVEYDVGLDAKGRVKTLVKTRASSDIAYDEAVAKAITGSKLFPPETMRQFSVYFTFTP